MTPVLADKIVSAMRVGAYFDVACEQAGVPTMVGTQWLRRGDSGKGTEVYQEFARRVRLAIASCETALQAVLVTCAKGERAADGSYALHPEWRAAAFMLERRFAGRWGRRDVVRHQVPDALTEIEEIRADQDDPIDHERELQRCNLALKAYVERDEDDDG